MKNQFLVYFLATFILFSCKNRQKELTEMNSFLQANYEFNKRTFDFPVDYESFENKWFLESNTFYKPFTYSIFDNDKWIEPWTNNELYDVIIEKLEECFTKTFIEIDSDSESEKIYDDINYK